MAVTERVTGSLGGRLGKSSAKRCEIFSARYTIWGGEEGLLYE